MISFVVPVYNTKPEWMHRAINSVRSQTCKDWELLIVDDGSRKEIAEELDRISMLDNRIRVFHQSNQGVSVARNTGMDAAKGDYVAFLDSDDWISEDYIESVKDYLERETPDMMAFAHSDHRGDLVNECLHNTPEFIIYEATEKKRMEACNMHAVDVEDRYTMFFGAQWNILYKRNFINMFEIRNVPGLYVGEDSVFNLYAIEYARKICYLNKVLYHYFINDNSALNIYHPGYKQISNLLIERKKFIDKFHPKEQEYFIAFNYGCIIVFDGLCKRNFFHKENKTPISARKNELNELLSSEPYASMLREIDTSSLTKFKKIQIMAMKRRSFGLLWLLFKLKKAKRRR